MPTKRETLICEECGDPYEGVKCMDKLHKCPECRRTVKPLPQEQKLELDLAYHTDPGLALVDDTDPEFGPKWGFASIGDPDYGTRWQRITASVQSLPASPSASSSTR